MTELEKVMKELSWLISNFPLQKSPIDAADRMCNAINVYCNDALALLKEKMPRLVTTADFENNPNLDDGYHLNVWEEYKDGARCGWDTINVNDVRAFTDLRRYWTSRPSPEQMAKTPWEGDAE